MDNSGDLIVDQMSQNKKASTWKVFIFVFGLIIVLYILTYISSLIFHFKIIPCGRLGTTYYTGQGNQTASCVLNRDSGLTILFMIINAIILFSFLIIYTIRRHKKSDLN